MSGFYIKSITAHGNGKSNAMISFGEGLNIIQGYSDTGKTCIVKCIDLYSEVRRSLLIKVQATLASPCRLSRQMV